MSSAVPECAAMSQGMDHSSPCIAASTSYTLY